MIAGYEIATFCGSMRYYPRMLELAGEYTAQGVICILPHVTVAPMDQEDNVFKKMLDDMHKRKIDMCDYVIVVGKHIGESTASEKRYTRQCGKQIIHRD